jgi:hypothetical protein
MLDVERIQHEYTASSHDNGSDVMCGVVPFASKRRTMKGGWQQQSLCPGISGPKNACGGMKLTIPSRFPRLFQ